MLSELFFLLCLVFKKWYPRFSEKKTKYDRTILFHLNFNFLFKFQQQLSNLQALEILIN